MSNSITHQILAPGFAHTLALNSAHIFVQLLVAVYNAINIFASSRIAAADWPKLLPAHNSQNRNAA